MKQNNVFEDLKSAVAKSQDELDLPDHVANAVLEIANNPVFYASKEILVRELADMVLDYHTYAEACCERLGSTVGDIEFLMNYIKSSVKSA